MPDKASDIHFRLPLGEKRSVDEAKLRTYTPERDDWIYVHEEADEETIHRHTKRSEQKYDLLAESTEAMTQLATGYLSGLLDVDLEDQLGVCTGWVEDAQDTILSAMGDFIEVAKSWVGWGQKFSHVKDGITKMVTIIKQLAMDPLKKPEHVQTMEEAEDMMREIQGKKKKKRKQKKKGPELETAMLEHTIIRIGDLIQVGFGTSGKDVIGKNMSCGDGELATMLDEFVTLSSVGDEPLADEHCEQCAKLLIGPGASDDGALLPERMVVDAFVAPFDLRERLVARGQPLEIARDGLVGRALGRPPASTHR